MNRICIFNSAYRSSCSNWSLALPDLTVRVCSWSLLLLHLHRLPFCNLLKPWWLFPYLELLFLLLMQVPDWILLKVSYSDVKDPLASVLWPLFNTAMHFSVPSFSKSALLWSPLKMIYRAGEIAPWLRVLAACRGPKLGSQHHVRWLTAAYNSYSRRSNAVSGLLRYWTHMAHNKDHYLG